MEEVYRETICTRCQYSSTCEYAKEVLKLMRFYYEILMNDIEDEFPVEIICHRREEIL